MNKYIIVSSLPWFTDSKKGNFFKNLNTIEINKKDELTIENLNKINPRYIFFVHWNWIVPKCIFEKYECVVFHTAPLPYGRGGSPLQNLILRGFKNVPVCALKMTNILDGGPIYCSENISLDGTIENIFSRIAVAVEKLINYICLNNPTPIEQVGEPYYFSRLSSCDNELTANLDIQQIYDRIRMVDGQNYPRAYIKFGNYKIEITNSTLTNSELTAKIRIYKNEH